jgi:hypothetical protein
LISYVPHGLNHDIFKPLDKFKTLILENNDSQLIGFSASNEQMYHYTDFLRSYNKEGIKIIHDHYNKTKNQVKNMLNAIELNEVSSTNLFESKKVLFDAEQNYNGNIFFNDTYLEDYLTNKDLPIIKLKKLYKIDNEQINNDTYDNKLPLDFDPSIYKNENPDLINLNNDEAINHYLNHGINEGRNYKKNDESSYKLNNKMKNMLEKINVNIDIFDD